MTFDQIIPPVPSLFYNPSNPDVVVHQLIETPQDSDSVALKAAQMYSQTGLRIVDGAATDANGHSVSLPMGLITTKSFYDPREQRTMTLTEVDVSVLGSRDPLASDLGKQKKS